jgi:hypothetical protein
MAVDEQIIVDIKVDSKDVNTAEKSIDRLTQSIEELSNEIINARKQNKEFKKQQKELDDLYKSGKISLEKYEKGVDQLNSQIFENNKTIAKGTIELSKQKSERAANIKLVNSEAGALGQLEAKATLLNKAITKQSKATKEGREEFDKLEKELKQVNESINESRQAFADNTKNIGNYPKVAGPAIVSLNEIGEGMETVGGSSGRAVGGIRSMGAAFKALLANPVVLTLAAIVGALTALFSAFKRSESGSRLLNKAMAGLKGLFAVLTKFADLFGKAVEKSMDDSNEATVGFWAALKQNVINRLEGLVMLAQSVGENLKAMWEGNTKAMEAASKKAKNALIAITTGLDESQFDGLINKMKEFGAFAALVSQSFLKLEDAQRASRAATRFLEKDVAKLSAEFEQLAEVAGDDTRNLHEMKQAAVDAGEAAAKLATRQVSLAAERLSILRKEVQVRRFAGEEIQDLLDEQAQAEVALTDARSQAAIAQQKILIEQRKIERDIFEQNLDILIDVGDKIKTAQEKAIQDESTSLEKRRMLLEASKAALAANFGEIKKEYELYGITAEQINDVINASDAKQANEKLKALGLNEIANNRLREIILERKQAELDFNELSKELSDEEVERKQAANETIKEINDEAALNEIDNAEDLRDKLIELENEKLKLKLENENLLAEEREALILESQDRIREIEEEFDEEKREKDEEAFEERKEILEEQFEELIEITQDFAGAEAAIFTKIASGIAKAFEDGKVSATSALQGISMISNAVFDSLSERRAQDLSQVEASRQAELDLAEGNAAAQDAINQEFDKKSAALKLKQFRADKAKALLDIGISTAAAIVKTTANLGMPAAIPFVAIAGALGIAQGIVVAAKKPPKFGGGVNDIVNIGGSHASGNDTDVYGFSGGQSQYFGKVERGEAMPVIRKSAANDYQIAKLNGHFNSVGRSFANGTDDITRQAQPQNNDFFVAQLVTAIEDINIVAKIEDITKEARKKVQIVDNSKF